MVHSAFMRHSDPSCFHQSNIGKEFLNISCHHLCHPTNVCVYMKAAKHVYCVFLFKEQAVGCLGIMF